MEYREIDHLLMNVNKGAGSSGRSTKDDSGVPRPGDSVMVSVGDRGLLNILIHRTHGANQTFMGETMGQVCDDTGRQIIGGAARVSFSYNKIAGIHRR